MAMCPSTTPGFSPMPPTVIQRGWALAGRMPQPAPFPNMPTALNQVFQPLGEASCRSTVDDIVIKTDRQTQIVPDGDVPVHDPWLLTNATHRHPEGMGIGWKNAPASPFPKHAHGTQSGLSTAR